jgi:hypothetical protein
MSSNATAGLAVTSKTTGLCSSVFDNLNFPAVTVPPTFDSVAMNNGTQLVFGGSGGLAGRAYYVLASTNLALPLSNWTRFASNWFDGAGNFRCTNTVDPAVPAQLFRLSLP